MFSLKHLVLQEKTFGAKSCITDAFPQVTSILTFYISFPMRCRVKCETRHQLGAASVTMDNYYFDKNM